MAGGRLVARKRMLVFFAYLRANRRYIERRDKSRTLLGGI